MPIFQQIGSKGDLGGYMIEIEEMDEINFLAKLLKASKSNDIAVVIGVPNNTLVLKGKSECNSKAAEDRGIKLIEGLNIGSSIVLFKGDLEYALFVKNGGNSPMQLLIDGIVDYLKLKNLNVKFDNNDVMIDDIYKVCACALTPLDNNMYYYAIHISMSVDLDLIKSICTKPMNKIPKGLSDYGITAEEMENLLLDITNKLIGGKND